MEEKSRLLKETKEKYDRLLKEAKDPYEQRLEQVMNQKMYELKMRHNEKCQDIVKMFRQGSGTAEEKQEVARLLREARKEFEHEKERICPEKDRNDLKESSLSRNARILAKRFEIHGEDTDVIRRRQRLDFEENREEMLAEQKNEADNSSSSLAPASSSGRRVHGIYEHYDDCPDDPKYSICRHCSRKVSDENMIFDFWLICPREGCEQRINFLVSDLQRISYSTQDVYHQHEGSCRENSP